MTDMSRAQFSRQELSDVTGWMADVADKLGIGRDADLADIFVAATAQADFEDWGNYDEQVKEEVVAEYIDSMEVFNGEVVILMRGTEYDPITKYPKPGITFGTPRLYILQGRELKAAITSLYSRYSNDMLIFDKKLDKFLLLDHENRIGILK